MSEKKKKPELFGGLKRQISGFGSSGLIRRNTQAYTGINLGSGFIKGVTVRQGRVTACFVEPKGEISDTIDILKKRKAIEEKKIKISLKDSSCLVRYFSFPKTDKKKLKQAIYYQLNKYIPYPPGEVYFDYAVLKEISPSQDYILLAVAKKNYIQEILAIFTKKGLSVSEITLDSISLINLYLNRYPEDEKINSCLLDLGHSFSTMNIFEKGVPFLSREAKFCTKDIIDIIVRTKEIKNSEDFFSSICVRIGKFFDIVEEEVSSWCKEIRNAFDFFELNREDKIDKLYITGGLASAPGLTDIFSKQLEVPTEVFEPCSQDAPGLRAVFKDEKMKFFKNNLAVSFGLAL